MAAPTHPQGMTRMGTPTAVHHEDAGTKSPHLHNENRAILR